MEVGNILDHGWLVVQAPREVAIGQMLTVVHTNVKAQARICGVSSSDPATLTHMRSRIQILASARSRRLLVPLDITTDQRGVMIEIFDEKYPMIPATLGSSLPWIALEFAKLAEDLSKLHAVGAAHGFISPERLYATNTGDARLMIVGTLDYLVSPTAVTPSPQQDVLALARLFGQFAYRNCELEGWAREATNALINRGPEYGPLSSMQSLAQALNTFAERTKPKLLLDLSLESDTHQVAPLPKGIPGLVVAAVLAGFRAVVIMTDETRNTRVVIELLLALGCLIVAGIWYLFWKRSLQQ